MLPLASGADGVKLRPAQAVPAPPVAETAPNTFGSGTGQGLAALPAAPQDGVRRSWVTLFDSAWFGGRVGVDHRERAAQVLTDRDGDGGGHGLVYAHAGQGRAAQKQHGQDDRHREHHPPPDELGRPHGPPFLHPRRVSHSTPGGGQPATLR